MVCCSPLNNDYLQRKVVSFVNCKSFVIIWWYLHSNALWCTIFLVSLPGGKTWDRGSWEKAGFSRLSLETLNDWKQLLHYMFYLGWLLRSYCSVNFLLIAVCHYKDAVCRSFGILWLTILLLIVDYKTEILALYMYKYSCMFVYFELSQILLIRDILLYN